MKSAQPGQLQTPSPCTGAPSFSSLERQRKCWGEAGAASPELTPSLVAGLTLDKQLQSIYLRPYGAGEQVCR